MGAYGLENYPIAHQLRLDQAAIDQLVAFEPGPELEQLPARRVPDPATKQQRPETGGDNDAGRPDQPGGNTG
jgi:hypothetical protein